MTSALPMISPVFVPTIAVTAMPAIVVSMPRLVFRHVNFLIPSVAHKIDRSATGIVFPAMLFPVLLVSGRDVQVERLGYHPSRRRNDHDRPRVNELRLREVPDVNMSIKTGLANADRNTDAGGIC